MQTLSELFLSFLKIGFFTFGGGYAMIPFLQSEALANSWMTLDQFANIVAISQITPGPVAVNMATFVGYSQGLLPGALVATLGVCMPSITIMAVLARFFVKFGEMPLVKRIFFGLRPAVTGLIFAAVFFIARLEIAPEGVLSLNAGGMKTLLLSAACFVAMYRFKASPILCVVCAAAVGVAIF